VRQDKKVKQLFKVVKSNISQRSRERQPDTADGEEALRINESIRQLEGEIT